MAHSRPETARRSDFAATMGRAECSPCQYLRIGWKGCPKLRHARCSRFDDIDCFSEAYKMIYARALP